jgi:hypothetical protein
MSDGTFDFNVFIKESKDVLLNPKSYFSTMKTSGGMTEPLIKAVIYGVVAGAIAFLWSIMNIGGIAGGILGGGIGVMAFFSYAFGSLIGLFIGAVVILVISSICKGSNDFESCVRVSAALMVMLPITVLIGFAGSINIYLGILINLAASLYSLWLLYNALIEALKAQPETTKIVMYIFIALIVLGMLASIGPKRKADRFLRELQNTEIK